MGDQSVERIPLERATRRVEKYYKAGTASRWGAALWAALVVGRYERGATLGLARRLLVSVSAVENLAVAGITYKHLRAFARNSRARSRLLRRARRALPYTHFVVLGECWRRYEFSPYEALRYLVIAMRCRMTAAELRAQIDDEQQSGPDTGAGGLDIDSRKWSPAGEKARQVEAAAVAAAHGFRGRVVERFEQAGSPVVSVALASADGEINVGAQVLIVLVGE